MFKPSLRLAIVVLLSWLLVLSATFFATGGMSVSNKYILFGVGPSPDLWLLGIQIHTWPRWLCLVFLVSMDTAVNTWACEIIGPWIGNQVYDFKVLVIEYSKAETMAITNLFYLYHGLRGIFLVYLAFTQVDIILCRVFVDFLVTLWTSWTYISAKKYEANDAESADELEKLV